MSRLKSKYRQAFKNGGAVNAQPAQDELQIDRLVEQPTETIIAQPEAPVPTAEPSAPPLPQQEPENDATLALRRQIEGLRRSEHMQRQQPAIPAQPMTREQRLAAWQAHGISPAEVEFFQRNPAMVDNPQITGFAVQKALEAGLERGTEAHFAAVEKIFNANLAHQVQAANPDMQTPTPQFFKPPPGPPARSANPSSLVSAPVSRSVPNGSGKRHSNGKIRLTPAEIEAARISGLSVEQYAKEKLRYENMRAAGEYRDQR